MFGQELKSVGKNFSIQRPYHAVGLKYISIGDDFRAFGGLRIEAIDDYFGEPFTPEIIIGSDVSINYNCHIGSVNKIVIGNHVLLASNVFITDHFHGETSRESLEKPPLQRTIRSRGPVIIEESVLIGENAAIMPGVTIGHHAVIGSNAVVTTDVPPFAVVGGVPAKIIKQV
jgi:acetyltransferase-like isoleucine patch superfamily enzyme